MTVTYPIIPPPTYDSQIEFYPCVRRSGRSTRGEIQQVKERDSFVWNVSAAWLLNSVEMEIFRGWFKEDLFYGSKVFSMPFPWGDDEETAFEFVDGTYDVSQTGFLHFRVSAKLRTVHLPTLADEDSYRMAITTPNILQGTHGVFFSETFELSGARTGPVVFDPNEPSDLPPWATLTQAGVLSGTPTVEGLFRITTGIVPNTSKGEAYSWLIKTRFEVGDVSFAVTDGSLPTGLSIGLTTGVISGTVPIDPVAVTTSAIPTQPANTDFSVRIRAKGGKSPIAFTTPYLPPGLALSVNGFLSGNISFWSPVPLKILNHPDLGSALIGKPFSAKINSFGGRPDTTEYTVTDGALPTGLTFNSVTGVISGTPTS